MSVNPFLKKNKKVRKPVKVYVSDLFVDENDKPVPIEFKVISAKESENLRTTCQRPVIDPQTRKKVGEELDQELFQKWLLAKSMVYPDLTDPEMQKSWGVNNEIDLLTEMFDAKEQLELVREFDALYKSEDEIAQEAENDTKNV